MSDNQVDLSFLTELATMQERARKERERLIDAVRKLDAFLGENSFEGFEPSKRSNEPREKAKFGARTLRHIIVKPMTALEILDAAKSHYGYSGLTSEELTAVMEANKDKYPLDHKTKKYSPAK